MSEAHAATRRRTPSQDSATPASEPRESASPGLAVQEAPVFVEMGELAAPSVPDGMPVVDFLTTLQSRAREYGDLAKLRLSSLVLFTVGVGYLAAAAPGASIAGFLWTMLGVLAVTASGAILNQCLEVGLDRKMARTADRPIVAGRLGLAEATTVGILAGVVGLPLLWFAVNPLTAGLAALAWVLYVGVYTPLKTRTTANTLVGAVSGALPPVMGYAGAAGAIDAGALWLFALQFAWQLPHFLAIAWLYREDYARAGFRMLSGAPNGGRRTMRQIRAYSVAMVPLSLLPVLVPSWFATGAPAGTGFGAGWLYGIAAAVSGLAFLAVALRTARCRTLDSARSLFLASVMYLPALLGALALDRFLLG